MKKVAEYIKTDSIIMDLQSKDKKSIIKELFDSLSNSKEVVNKEKCYEDILLREKIGSTGIGEGFAIPHAKTDGVKDLIMTIGISRNEIEYDSVDNSKVNVFFMFLSPVDLSQEYLIILAKISRFIREKDFLKEILSAKTKEELVHIIYSKEEA